MTVMAKFGLLRGLCVAVALMVGAAASADSWKTVETSDKKMPAWLSASPGAGYIVVTAEAPSLQEARKMAENEISRTIIQAVATNVTYSSVQTSANRVENDRVTTTDDFSSEYELAAARLPFIKGVSLSEAAGTYWERRENKQSKQNLYVFTVLYPFSESELADLRRKFEAYDGEKTAAFDRVKSGYETVSSTEGINEAIATLTDLGEYFFDSVRRREAESLLKRYRDLFRSVVITGERTGEESYLVSTTLRGKPFATGRTPEVTSDCACRIKVVPTADGTAFNVTFSTEDCLEGELNTLKVSVRLGTARLSTELDI